MDHGAQYFTMHSAAFASAMKDLCGETLETLGAPIRNLESGETWGGPDRYYRTDGNNRIGKALLGNLPIRMETLVKTPIRSSSNRWIVEGEQFDSIVTCAPWPQTLGLLGLPEDCASYAPCLTALFAYRGRWAGNSRDTYAFSSETSPLKWSACENHKTGRVSGDETVFVAQASPGFSREYLEADPGEWSELLRQQLEGIWFLRADTLVDRMTHRWRYARLSNVAPAAVAELPPGFFVAGDACSESRLESVWNSGRETAGSVLHYLGMG